MKQHRVCLLTPTYRRDFDRFCLQRESIERCGVELPHVAVVQHEDMPLFQSIPFRSNLTLLSTKDVLPQDIERRRTAWGYRRRHWRRWLGWRPIHGWMSQQLIKLSAPAFIDAEAVVCLDSDLVFIRGIADEDFLAPDGRVQLYELPDGLDAEMAEWLGRSMRFLGIQPVGQPLRRYTYSPAPMHCGILQDMHRFIEDKYARPWIHAILGTEMITEFATYGVFARYVDRLERVSPVVPDVVHWFWWASEVGRLEEQIGRVVSNPRTKMVGVQSNAGRVPAEYRHLLDRVWAVGAI